MCAMKVGTDAVLLGAWARAERASKILDIGTGTGVIAIMLAQRSKANITAIDLDEKAYEQALINVTRSPWADRMEVVHSTLQSYTQTYTGKRFDLIISNPPFFIDSFKSPEERRKNARHADHLPFAELIDCVVKLLTPEGDFCVILPVKEALLFTDLCNKAGLFPSKCLHVKTTRYKEEKRQLLNFGFQKTETKNEELIIEEEGRHQYSEAYKSLTRDYYLSF